ncbi:MAG: bifunctional glutamate N-acetyltransferase/amino-acid acetyltransferase ArgJ [Deltaproteobacteria bacterium]|nr:bifunctional glutamate N-acetyltransferase/amino-acid acetyltransferase ArgJ [Deltaproteobacteria bacterium]
MRDKPLCPGFKAAGISAGIKKDGAKDLGLIVSETPAAVTGVFTKNRIQAAPVQLDRERVQSGQCHAIIVNSGNANCCTGAQGMADAREMTAMVAQSLGISKESVLVASTGVIGEPMPMAVVRGAIPELVSALSLDGIMDCAVAIMTTDTVPKTISRSGELDGRVFNVTGMVKGAGMIRPDMATMLSFIMTDASVPAGFLKQALGRAVDRSFNRASIDGDTSTNDTVLLMANGVSGANIAAPAHESAFQKVLDEVCHELAKAMVRDGEGVTKFIEIMVKGAQSDGDAFRIVDTVAHSPLVKTAFFGEDANWGRLIMAVGRAGSELDPDKIDIFFDQVRMVKDGMGCGPEAEAQATAVLKKPDMTITIDLNIGDGQASMITCDFSVDYVRINADYRS